MVRRACAGVVVLLLVGCTGAPVRPPSVAATPAVARETPATAVPPQSPEIPAAVLSGLDLKLATEIVRTALEYDRTRQVYEGRAFRVASVALREPGDFGYDGPYWYVLIEFDQPLDPLVWPGDACAIERQSNDITGIAWLVSVETDEVEASSPQWDYAIDCLG